MINISNAQHLCLLWIGIFIHTVFKLFSHQFFKDLVLSSGTAIPSPIEHSLLLPERYYLFFHCIDALCSTYIGTVWCGSPFHFAHSLFWYGFAHETLKVPATFDSDSLSRHEFMVICACCIPETNGHRTVPWAHESQCRYRRIPVQ